MNSYNHYAYGAIGDWMYRVIAGIDTKDEAPGYKQIQIKPHIGGSLTKAAAQLKTYYGTVSSSWKQENGQLIFDVEIPVNTTAEVHVPASDAGSVTESGKPLTSVKEIKLKGTEDGYILLSLGSGKYQFVVNNQKGLKTASNQ